MTAETVGQVFDRQGPCALMAAAVQLAERDGRIPCGFWVRELGDGWTLIINGTKKRRMSVEPWNGMMLHGNLPVVSFDSVSGIAVGHDGEDAALSALQRALTRAVQESSRG